MSLHYVYKNDPLFLSKISRDPAQTLTPFDVNIITLLLKCIFLYICLTSEADRKELQYLQCHANCSVFQVLICLKSKKAKSGTLVLSLVLHLPIPHFCLAIHFDRR